MKHGTFLRVLFYQWAAFAAKHGVGDEPIRTYRWILIEEFSDRRRRFAKDLHRRADRCDEDDTYKMWRALAWLMDLACELEIAHEPQPLGFCSDRHGRDAAMNMEVGQCEMRESG